MKANELRIGNWILNEKNQSIKVSWINNNIESISYPIPLTEEILSKCDFNMIDDFTEHSHIDLDLQHCITFLKDENLIIIECDDCCYNINLEHIKHLHQLQNLYFALTGQELTIML